MASEKFEFENGDIVCRVGLPGMWLVVGTSSREYDTGKDWILFEGYTVKEFLPDSRSVGLDTFEYPRSMFEMDGVKIGRWNPETRKVEEDE